MLQTNASMPLTHYMICESDRLRINGKSIVKKDGVIEFELLQQKSEFDWDAHPVALPSRMNEREHDLSVDGPVVKLTDQLGKIEYFDNSFLFLEILASRLGASESLGDLLHLAVKYIGQTEIANGYIRFDQHEKLNSIAAEIIADRPHREVWVKMLSFQKPFIRMMTIPGIDSPVRNDWHPEGGLMRNMPGDDLKTVIEGALIKYFQPVLNRHYKHNFPSDRHTSYKYFYENSFRSIVVELHEEYRTYKTGSETAPFTKTKLIEFALDSDDRGPFLHDNSVQDMDNMIAAIGA